MKNALIYLLVFVALQAGASIIVPPVWQRVTGSPDITAMMLITTTLLYSVIAIAVFLLARWSVVSRSYVRSRPWGVLFWCAVAALGAIIPSTWLQEQLPELPNLLETQFDMILKDRMGYVVVGLLAPLVEEVVFRGAILCALLRWTNRHWPAIALSALIFALVHGNPAQMPHAFLVGLLLGWMYWRTDSIVPGVAYHWVNNSIAYVLYNILPDPDAPLVVLFGGSGTKVIAAVLFSLCILLPALFQLNMRLRKTDGDHGMRLRKSR